MKGESQAPPTILWPQSPERGVLSFGKAEGALIDDVDVMGLVAGWTWLRLDTRPRSASGSCAHRDLRSGSGPNGTTLRVRALPRLATCGLPRSSVQDFAATLLRGYCPPAILPLDKSRKALRSARSASVTMRA